MSLFDFLKRKKEVEKAKKPDEKKTEKGLTAKKTKTEKPKLSTVDQSTVLNKKTRGFSYDIVKQPHISEKGTVLAKENKYVFKVYGAANKTETKKAIEGIYGVNVLSVHTIKIPAKKRRLGKTEGLKKGYTKAVVTIKEGQKIEIL